MEVVPFCISKTGSVYIVASVVMFTSSPILHCLWESTEITAQAQPTLEFRERWAGDSQWWFMCRPGQGSLGGDAC